MSEREFRLRRGAIVQVDLDPTVGHEANKVRPAVVVSNDSANAYAAETGLGMLTVVPLTSNVQRVYAFQALVPRAESGLPVDSKAQAEQLRSIDARRVVSVGSVLSAERMAAIDHAVAVQLAL